MNTNMLATYYELKYFSSLFNFYLSSVIGCLGNSTKFIFHIADVIIAEDRERGVGKQNLEDCKINSPCKMQYLIIARNETPRIINAFLSLNFLIVFLATFCKNEIRH